MLSCYRTPSRICRHPAGPSLAGRYLIGSALLLGLLLSLLITAVPPVHAQESGWTVNPSSYEHTMTATVAVTLDGQPAPGAELGAFINGDVRGTATATEGAGSDGQALHFITIHGNVESTGVELRLYNPESDSVHTTSASFPFAIDGIVGSPSNPFEAVFGAVSIPDVAAWEVDPGDYEHTMTLTASVHVDATDQSGGLADDRLAAFSPAGTVRGVAEPVAVGDAFLFFLTVHGNASDAGRMLPMQFYDTVTDTVYAVQEDLVFEINAVTGSPSQPVELVAVETSSDDEGADDEDPADEDPGDEEPSPDDPEDSDDTEAAPTLDIVTVAPNPTTTTSEVVVAANHTFPVRLALYDTLGREVAVLYEGALPGGQAQRVPLPAQRFASGMYWLHLTSSAGRPATRSVVIAR